MEVKIEGWYVLAASVYFTCCPMIKRKAQV